MISIRSISVILAGFATATLAAAQVSIGSIAMHSVVSEPFDLRLNTSDSVVRLELSTPPDEAGGFTLIVIRPEDLPASLASVAVSVIGTPEPLGGPTQHATALELGDTPDALAWNLPGALHRWPLDIRVVVTTAPGALLAQGTYPLRFEIIQRNPVRLDMRSIFDDWDAMFSTTPEER